MSEDRTDRVLQEGEYNDLLHSKVLCPSCPASDIRVAEGFIDGKFCIVLEFPKGRLIQEEIHISPKEHYSKALQKRIKDG